jgi:hypothetical protein
MGSVDEVDKYMNMIYKIVALMREEATLINTIIKNAPHEIQRTLLGRVRAIVPQSFLNSSPNSIYVKPNGNTILPGNAPNPHLAELREEEGKSLRLNPSAKEYVPSKYNPYAKEFVMGGKKTRKAHKRNRK